MSRSSFSSLVTPALLASVESFFEDQCTAITPAFPNWEKSFISGPKSPLFQLEHRIMNTNSSLLITQASFKSFAEGPPGSVHGGASAALIDECMGIIVWHNQHFCLTQGLSLQYKRTLPLDSLVYVVTEITQVTERELLVHSQIIEKKARDPNGTPRVYVSGEGKFFPLSTEQLDRLIKKSKTV